MELPTTAADTLETKFDRVFDASEAKWVTPALKRHASGWKKMFSYVEIDPSRLIKPEHEFAGETFELQTEQGLIRLCHKRWSLEGEGSTLLDAEQDLVSNARIIAEAYLRSPVERMTQNALALREFLFNVI